MFLRKVKLNSNLILGFTASVALFLGACSNDDDKSEEDLIGEKKTTGFVGVSTTSTGSTLVKYFDEIPTGTIDFSDGKDFARFQVLSVFDHTMYTRRTDGLLGFAKVVVNEDGEVVEEATLPTAVDRARLSIRDAETGVFQNDLDSNSISVFNPTTFEVTGTIDMSQGSVPEGVEQRYGKFIFRGDDVFTDLRNNEGSTNPYFTDYIVHQANLTTNTFVGDTKREGNGFGTIRISNKLGQDLTDTAGNLYMPDEGNWEGAGLAARLNKIPAGSNEIDPTYVFEPALKLNPQSLLPLFNSFNFLENGKAIALVNKDTPAEALKIVISVGGVLANLSSEQLSELSNIIFTSETAVWCEIDVVAQTVTPIEGIPNVGPIVIGVPSFEHNGEVYIPTTRSAENAYYKWNSTTGGAATKAFTITGSSSVPLFYNIEKNKG